MALAMLLRRMGVDITVHGFRTSFRTWCSDVAHAEFEVAEQCLSHRVGNDVSRSYNRTSMFERRRPIMTAWANFVCNSNADNVVPLRPAQLSLEEQEVIDALEASRGRPLTREERHLSLAGQGDRRNLMIRIAITVEAFEALARTLPLGSVGYENQINERGERLIWLDHAVVARLRAMRGHGESYSDVILRLVADAERETDACAR